MIELIPAASIVLAVWLLYRNWRDSRGWGHHFCTAAVLVGSWAIWVQVSGVEYGTVYCLLLASLSAWALILVGNPQTVLALTAPRNLAGHSPKAVVPNAAKGWRYVMNFVVMIVLACVTSVSLSLLVVPLVPVTTASQLVLAAILFPCVWSLLVVWTCFDRIAWRPAAGMVVLSGTASTLLWVAS